MTTQKAIDMIVELGRDHRRAIINQTMFTNALKGCVRTYLGDEELYSGDGESLDKRKLTAAYKRLLVDKADPLFLNRESELITGRDSLKARQEILAKKMGYWLTGGIHGIREDGVMVKVDYGPGLPIWHNWAEQQRGCGAPMLAKIIAEVGRDLNEFETPAKLWKWFGEHVVNGEAARARKGEKLGFSKTRRSISWQLGDGLIKAGGTVDKGNLSPWKTVYEHRKKYEIARAEANGLTVVPSAKITKKNEHLHMSEGHVHNRAAKFMRKKFLEAFWQEWTGSHRDMELPGFITDPKKGD